MSKPNSVVCISSLYSKSWWFYFHSTSARRNSGRSRQTCPQHDSLSLTPIKVSYTSTLFRPLFCCSVISYFSFPVCVLHPGRSYYWPTRKRFPVVSLFPRINIQLVNKFLRCAACYVCNPLSLTLNFSALLNFFIRQRSEDTQTPWFPLPSLRHLATLCLVRGLPSSE